MSETWRAVVGHEGEYEVSDLGRVRSLDRTLTSPVARRGYPRVVRGQLLRPQLHPGGYLHVRVGKRTRLISHLVLEAFVGPRPVEQEACHGDGDRQNNALTNLRWGTHVDNCADRVAHGTHPIGEKNGGAKLTALEVQAIRASILDRNSLADTYGVSANHIDRIRRGERWSHV
jgi:hypothetical protein